MAWPPAAQRVLLAVAVLLLALGAFAARREAAPVAVPVPDEPAVELRLDLNAATAADLETLPGIGAVLAARIVAHRDARGPFRSLRELGDVPGVGARLAARVAPLLTVGPVPDAPGARGAGRAAAGGVAQ